MNVGTEQLFQLLGKRRAAVLKRTLTTAFPDLPRPGLGGDHKQREKHSKLFSKQTDVVPPAFGAARPRGYWLDVIAAMETPAGVGRRGPRGVSTVTGKAAEAVASVCL